MYLLKVNRESLICRPDFQKLQSLKVFTFLIWEILSLLNDYRNLLLHYNHLVYHSFLNLSDHFQFIHLSILNRLNFFATVIQSVMHMLKLSFSNISGLMSLVHFYQFLFFVEFPVTMRLNSSYSPKSTKAK